MLNKLLCFLFVLSSWSATAGDTTNAQSIRIHFGIGPSVYSGVAGVPRHLKTTVNKTGICYSGRIMFHGNHRLSFGFESGYIPLYRYTIDDEVGKVTIHAVPLLMEWGFRPFKNLIVYGGTGTYFVRTMLDYGGIVKSGNLSIGWMAAAQYHVPVSKQLSVAGEFKWYNASESHDATLNLQLQLIWTILNW